MANRKFTEQEMLTLRNSKYVLDVSPSIVHFSAEFKNYFGRNCQKAGFHVRLFRLLNRSKYPGDSRINGLKTMIGNEVKREMVFEILTPMHRAATDIFRLKIG